MGSGLVCSIHFIDEGVDELALRGGVGHLLAHHLVGHGEGHGANLLAESLLGLLPLLVDGELGGIHDLAGFDSCGVAGLLDDTSLHLVGLAKDIGLLATGLGNLSIGFGAGVVELFLCALGILHTLVDKVGTALHAFYDDRPGPLPETEEEDAKGHEHPKDEAKIGLK